MVAVVCLHSVVEGVRYQVSPHPDYVATWEIANGTIDFVAAVRTTGWVGLAVNYQPKMAGADIMFGGVDYYGGRGNYIYVSLWFPLSFFESQLPFCRMLHL